MPRSLGGGALFCRREQTERLAPLGLLGGTMISILMSNIRTAGGRGTPLALVFFEMPLGIQMTIWMEDTP
jgi:hypothetical protein